MTEAKQKAKKQAETAIAKVRDIADETTAAAEETAKKAQATADETAKVFEDTGVLLKDGLTSWQQKAFELAKANLDSGFDFAQKLVGAKTPAEAFELHAEYTRKQVADLSSQAQELGALSVKVAEDAAKPAQEGILKSFDEMKKAFAA
ncbi:MAG: phasin family protein [Hyphomicrobiales bacterium]